MSNTRELKIGSPANGHNFYPRNDLRRRILRALSRDHIAFLGPRRTGKTSILLDIAINPPEVLLMFEVVSDAFKAHADKDHLHRLAPERRAPVMELLKRLNAEPRSNP